MAEGLDIRVRQAKASEFDQVLAWTVTDVCAGDVSTWKATDAHGLLVGVVGRDVCGGAVALRYDERHGFVALHAVLPASRNSGVGQALWRAAMDHLKGCCVGIDARPEQRGECADYGFAVAFRSIRYVGTGDGRACTHAGLVPLTRIGLGRVQEFDRLVFGASRAKQLRRWVDGRGATGLGIDLGYGLAGYGMMEVCRGGYRLGPVYAEAPELAEVLLQGLLAVVPGGKAVHIHVPEANPPATALARRLGMRKSGESFRMYSGGPPTAGLDRWFAVSVAAG